MHAAVSILILLLEDNVVQCFSRFLHFPFLLPTFSVLRFQTKPIGLNVFRNIRIWNTIIYIYIWIMHRKDEIIICRYMLIYIYYVKQSIYTCICIWDSLLFWIHPAKKLAFIKKKKPIPCTKLTEKSADEDIKNNNTKKNAKR